MTNELNYAGKYFTPARPKIWDWMFAESVSLIQQVEFPDVSFYQGTIDFSKMKQVAIFRAGQNIWIDTQFERNRSEAEAHQMTWGIYWFYDDRVSPLAQADKLFTLFSSGQARPTMEIFCDWEKSYDGPYSGVKNVCAFLTRIEQLMPWAKVGVYTSYYWFKNQTDPALHATQYTYLKNKALWLAWWTSNASNVLIPPPWTTVTHWQYGTPSRGAEFGTETTEIDMNWSNCTASEFFLKYSGIIAPPQIDFEYKQIRASGSDVFIVSIDPTKYTMKVTNTHGYLETVSTAAKKMGAQIAINADGWAENGSYPHLPYSLAVSEGIRYQDQFDFRPFVAVNDVGQFSIRHSDLKDILNAASGTRYIVTNSVKPVSLFGTEVQYTERHPRTACGVTATGRLILVVVDGRSSTSSGVTLSELADLLIAENVVTGIDMDGGGSSALWYNGQIKNVPSDGQERGVVNHLVFIKKGELQMNLAKTLNSPVALWTTKQGTKTGKTFPPNTQFEYKSVSGTWIEMMDGQWINAGVGWIYAIILSSPVEPPPPDPTSQIALTFNSTKEIIVKHNEITIGVYPSGVVTIETKA